MTRTQYTRGELIATCQRAFVPENNWLDRDSAGAQKQVGECLALLHAGCEFKILHGDDGYCSTDEQTIWVEIQCRGFADFEYGDRPERNTYYLPTAARLESRGQGKDWY